jgi:hypothetical protein
LQSDIETEPSDREPEIASEPPLEEPDVRTAPSLEESQQRTISLSVGDFRLVQLWTFAVFSFLVALLGWWVSNSYFNDASAKESLGFWVPNDRPAWLPFSSHFRPLIGEHFFGDFFQLYYLIRSHVAYTGHIFHTSLNPGYLLPAYLVSWLPYPLAGYVYLVVLAILWLLPAVLIARRSSLLAVLYLVATTLSVPGLMALDLGQPQVVVYILAIFSFYYLQSRPVLASSLLGLAIAIKPYMAIFLLIYLVSREYRSILRSVVVGVVVNIALAVALVGRTTIRVHFWDTILRGFLNYGSGGHQQIWANGAFLRNNSSIYGLAVTLNAAHVSWLMSITRLIIVHYNVFTVISLIVTLGWYFWKRAALSTEMQWVYLTVVLLLIPSYSIGYAWLLLLVPFVCRAMKPSTVSPSGSPGTLPQRSLLDGYLPYVIILAVAIYPANITLTAFPSAQFGPNGNTLITPILLVTALVMMWATTGPRKASRPRRAAHAGGRQHNPKLSYPVLVVPVVQVGVVVACYFLSTR